MKPNTYQIGDCIEVLRTIPDQTFQCCVTSPPYWGLRDYGHDGQIGLEETPEQYISRIVEVFAEVRRTLRDDGTLWLNLGDSYCQTDKWGGGKNGNTGKHTTTKEGVVPSWEARRSKRPKIDGIKPKDLMGLPWLVAISLRAAGWYLRRDIIWHKPNQMPESVTDRPTGDHEYLFLLSKSARYYYDAAAIAEPIVRGSAGSSFSGGKTAEHQAGRSSTNVREEKVTRNRRSVWTVPTQPYKGAHFATFPEDLVKPCILAGCPEGGLVLDPFLGSGTVGRVSEDLGRRWFGIELNPDYAPLIDERLGQRGLFA